MYNSKYNNYNCGKPAGGCEKIWRYMPTHTLKGNEAKMISTMSTIGSNMSNRVLQGDYVMSCECFVAGFENDASIYFLR